MNTSISPLELPTPTSNPNTALPILGSNGLVAPAFPIDGQAVCFVVNAFDPDNIGNEIDYANIGQVALHPEATVNFCDGNQALPWDNFAVYDLWNPGPITLNPPNGTTPQPIIAGGTAEARPLRHALHGGKI